MIQIDKYQHHAPKVLRIGLALVFLWFGISQILTPFNFVGYLPSFILNFTPGEVVVRLNGILETLLALLLIFKKYVRLVSAILALHLVTIILSLGYNEIAVRDFGLLLAMIAVFLNGK